MGRNCLKVRCYRANKGGGGKKQPGSKQDNLKCFIKKKKNVAFGVRLELKLK